MSAGLTAHSLHCKHVDEDNKSPQKGLDELSGTSDYIFCFSMFVVAFGIFHFASELDLTSLRLCNNTAFPAEPRINCELLKLSFLGSSLKRF